MRCKYIRKIFQNEENGYTVALFSTLDHEVPLSARDKFWADKKIIAFTAKGYDLPLSINSISNSKASFWFWAD